VQKAQITPALARQLIVEQFPRWADLPVTPVELDGWDNTTFRLGDALSMRLPSGDDYTAQVDKEWQWLPRLGAADLPLPIPQPVAQGEPSATFPRPWSVNRWLDGSPATLDAIDDLERFATDLGAFLVALYDVDATDGPPAGPHSHGRGGPLLHWNNQVRRSIEMLGERIDVAAVTSAWERSLAATSSAPPVWVHGDVAPSNLLTVDGELAAIIDFGCTAIGDPACDLVIAWTFFCGASRDAFRHAVRADRATWERSRGWLLWKALINLALAQIGDGDDDTTLLAWRRMGWRLDFAQVIDELLADG
jgi:aminoglycoside phosphotransferase (APT) family kinase protein